VSKISNLSLREKVLIYLLLVVALISGSIYLLILPTSEQHSNLEITLADAQYKEQEMQLIIESRPSIEKGITSINKQITVYQNNLYPLMNNDEIDKVITTMFIKNKLKPIELTLIDTAAQEIPAFLSAENTTKPILISNTMNAHCTVKNLGDFATMVSSIGKNPSMRVLAFTADFATNGAYTIDLDFIIYMVDKTNNNTNAFPAKEIEEAVE